MGRINLGDALQFWTKDVLKSTVHRVQIPTEQRYSIAYFCEADPDILLAQIGEDGVVDTSGQEKVLTSREWLFQRLRETQAYYITEFVRWRDYLFRTVCIVT